MDDWLTEAGSLGEAGCPGYDRVEHAFPEMLADFGHDLLGQARTPVEHGHDDAEEVEGGIDASIPELVQKPVDRGDALKGVILALQWDEKMVGRGECVQGEQTESRRAVDDKDVERPVILDRLEQAAESAESIVEASEFEFDAAKVYFAGDGEETFERGRFHSLDGGTLAEQGPVEAVALGLLEAEAAGGVGLGVEIDQKHPLPGGRHAGGEVDRRRRFSDAAFLIGDGKDGRRHGPI